MSHHAPNHTASVNLPGLLAVVHALGLIVFLSWRFGGMDPTGRLVAGCGCIVAPLVTILAWRQADASVRRHFLHIALPLAGIALLVVVSLFNPNMRILRAGGEPVGLVKRDDFLHFLPSTAWPQHTLNDFLLNAGLVLVGLNLFLARPTRAHQRLLLGVIAANAAILACAGSAFKLTHARLIFDTFPSPNPHFFASFFYYNHWGAFALLGTAAAAGLALQYRHGNTSGGWQRSPAPLLGVLALLLLVSLPLSGARASSAAGLILAVFLAIRLVPRYASGHSRPGVALGAALLVIGVLGAVTFWLARDRMTFLFRKTSSQVNEFQAGGIGDARLPIYQDTWKLFRQQPVFGWGWHSYRYAFRTVQSHDFKLENDQKEKTVVLDAHNDWLQLLAELGVAGAVLSLACLAGFARVASFRRWRLSPSLDLAAGVACVGLLACIDFPFACPAIVVSAWALLGTAAAIAYDRERQPGPG